MNSKKKNKKANKPPNPNPPQNIENIGESEKNIAKVDDKIDTKTKIEESVPNLEIVSTVVEVPVSDVKETEIDMPKIPKRNKGKKRNQDKNIDVAENIGEKSQVCQSEQSIEIQELSHVDSTDIKETLDTTCETTIVPSTRKKKNKKKPQDKQTEVLKIPDEDPIPTLEEHTTNKVIENIDTEIQELFTSKLETPKQENKKKKNKKKNRTDSEKSDQCDNITSTLLKDSVPNKSSDGDETVKTSEQIQEMIVDISQQNKTEEHNITESNIIEKINKKEDHEAIDVKTDKNDEGKSKRKNKKDKKTQQQEIDKDFVPNVLEKAPIVLGDLPSSEMFSDVPKAVLSVETDVSSKRELSPKPKAKIAKPVEKQRKGKRDNVPSDNSSDLKSVDELNIEKKDSSSVIKTEMKLDTPIDNIIETQPVDDIIGMQTDQKARKEINVEKPIESISVLCDLNIGKKRKKSPKPAKSKEDEEIIVEHDNMSLKQLSLIESEALKTETINISSLLESDIITDKPQEICSQKLTSSSQELLNIKPDQATLKLKKDDEVIDIKSSKKKKKSPKALEEVDQTFKTDTLVPIPETPIVKKDRENKKSKQLIEETIDFPKELSSSINLEVLSVGTDVSETSSCDAVPEVVFIRSSSEQFLDDNNNTIIQEVMHVEEIHLNDPFLMPFVENSGDTPIKTPELLTSSIKITELESTSLNEEKTDLKSKMMEVNQDMEELRLSIERSLAEFTALEKSDQETEKNIGTKKNMKEKIPLKEEKPNIVTEIKEKPLSKEDIQEHVRINIAATSETLLPSTPPACPSRKDNKSKNKSKKKGKQETTSAITTSSAQSTTVQANDGKKEEKSEQKSGQKSTNESSQEKGKQQATLTFDNSEKLKDVESNEQKLISKTKAEENLYHINEHVILKDTENISQEISKPEQSNFEPIEKFEDALTSSIDDVNKSFEMIVKEVDDDNIKLQKDLATNKPEINITEAKDDKDTNKDEKVNPVSPPKNLLGHTDIPVQSNRTDYKKEKNKTPGARQARVKIKDAVDIEKKQSKESQTVMKKASKNQENSVKESFIKVTNNKDEYVYKYSFRKVFLQSACHVCNKDLSQVRVPCAYCNLVFYCGARHKDEDWSRHQALCFAVSTLAHIKDQKHIYADAQNTTGQDYRLLRMQMIVSCEKVLKRRLVPWEQEAMLYPRICADVTCREWRQEKLKDCDGCGQLSFCATQPSHLPKSHARWCKSYSLYQKLVSYQQTKGRLEPKLPTKVITSELPMKMNEVLASMYEEKIDMNDIQYAALTQLATAPLTAAYCYQLYRKSAGITNGIFKKQPFTIHVVGAELQFEADALNKWETFFLHLRPDIEDFKVVLVSPMLNPGNLPLDILGKIRLCDNCQQKHRRVVFKFEDNMNYHEYRTSENFINPDIICAFNPSIQRSSIYNGKDPWPATINSILKLKQPFIVTSYTLSELRKDIARIKEVADMNFKLVLEPGFNNFASVRPDRNFISDDEMPLLFKNYCVAVVLGC